MISLDLLRNSWFLIVFIGGLVYWAARQDLSVAEHETFDTRITSLEIARRYWKPASAKSR